MVNEKSELEFEHQRLSETIALAEQQLAQARQNNEKNKSAIIAAKKELRDNTSHSIPNLWSSDGFEALAELSQDLNPVADKIADFEEVERKIQLLQNLMESPYFARIDFKFDDEDGFEKIYIGRTSLKKEGSYEMFIYDWRSPIASVYYRFLTGPAYYDAPGGRMTGEVNLKRQYEISNGKLDYFFDAEVQVVDEFLKQLLSQNTSPRMKAIVETIQKEQDTVIRDMENDLMMVQGVAGSGKTSIALHRAAYLMYQGLSAKLSAENIMIISPNSLFEQYISRVLPELGESNVMSKVFEDIMAAILHKRGIQSKNQFLEYLITSPYDHDMAKHSMEFKTFLQFKEILDRFILDIPLRWITFVDVIYEGKCIVAKEVLRSKIAGRTDTPLGIRLEQLESFILEAIYGTKNKRQHKVEKDLVKQEIQKYTKLDVENLYREMLCDNDYFYSLTNGMEPDLLDGILHYSRNNLAAGRLPYDDAVALSYLHLKIYGTSHYRNIKQVVIDEAQDYYPLQYEIFRLLFTNAKFTILGDMNQTLEKQEDLSLYEEIARILHKKKSTLVTMDKSFRCTNEILNYSLKFIGKQLDIKSFNRNGEHPKTHTAFSETELLDQITEEINICKERGYQSIGLVCKSEKNARFLFEGLKKQVEVQLIKDRSNLDLQGVFIIPVYMSKGLEFDAVLICDADRGNYHSNEDKNLLYIACTRALHRLQLFSQGEVSQLL